MSVREQDLIIEKTARLSLLGGTAAVRAVWIVCHGYGQLAHRFVRDFEAVASPHALVVAPEGLHRFYIDPPPAPAAKRRVGATWMTREARETDIRDYVAYLDRVREQFVPAGARLYALGFSQGTATAFRWAVLGAAAPDVLILWAGEVPPDVDLVPAAGRLRNTRLIVVYGRQDELVPEVMLRTQLTRLDEAGIKYELHAYDGGHELDPHLLAELAQPK